MGGVSAVPYEPVKRRALAKLDSGLRGNDESGTPPAHLRHSREGRNPVVTWRRSNPLDCPTLRPDNIGELQLPPRPDAEDRALSLVRIVGQGTLLRPRRHVFTSPLFLW
jgi:hypothetical protein